MVLSIKLVTQQKIIVFLKFKIFVIFTLAMYLIVDVFFFFDNITNILVLVTTTIQKLLFFYRLLLYDF